MELFNYQKPIFETIKKHDCYGLFMEAGTGKTIVSLEKYKYLKQNNKCKKLLVICLASKVNEWVDDCNNILNIQNSISLNQGLQNNKKLLMLDQEVYIISFQSLLLLKDYIIRFVKNDWLIIIDESQYIKNYKSKISKLCHKLALLTNYKLILTGTPQNKGYIDYFSQFKFLGIFKTLKEFQDRFCVMQQVRYGPSISFIDIVGYKNTNELDNIINQNAIFFKRDRNNDELPEQKYVYFNKIKLYDILKKDRAYEDFTCDNPGVLRLRLRQLCGGCNLGLNIKIQSDKIEWIKDLVENTFTKIVIFYNFNEECDLLYETITKLKRPVSIYNGTIKDTKNFLEKDNAILLVNYKSGGTGINWLKSAYICVFYSPPESYLEFEQARKRIDRIGQENKPMFYYLCTKHTVEEVIYKTLEQKEDFDNKKFMKYLEEK